MSFHEQKYMLGGPWALGLDVPPAILKISLKIQYDCQGVCLGLRPLPPPFCMKLAGAAEAGGRSGLDTLRPAILHVHENQAS